MHWRRKWQPTPVFLPGESQGRGSLVGCRLWGCTESDTTEATYQQLRPPWTVARQAPLSMGFFRQEYWRVLPLPSPGDLPNPGIEPISPPVQADSLPSEPPGKPKNTGVGSLSLLYGNFLTQELNQCLLHCRRILYQLNCQFILYVSLLFSH